MVQRRVGLTTQQRVQITETAQQYSDMIIPLAQRRELATKLGLPERQIYKKVWDLHRNQNKQTRNNDIGCSETDFVFELASLL